MTTQSLEDEMKDRMDGFAIAIAVAEKWALVEEAAGRREGRAARRLVDHLKKVHADTQCVMEALKE